ncbi:hypothetical protein ABE10_01645, partial [Bacillus toyonensis]|nr:hypothetical protein [Bacillus toyonensis]
EHVVPRGQIARGRGVGEDRVIGHVAVNRHVVRDPVRLPAGVVDTVGREGHGERVRGLVVRDAVEGRVKDRGGDGAARVPHPGLCEQALLPQPGPRVVHVAHDESRTGQVVARDTEVVVDGPVRILRMALVERRGEAALTGHDLSVGVQRPARSGAPVQARAVRGSRRDDGERRLAAHPAVGADVVGEGTEGGRGGDGAVGDRHACR